MNCSNFSVLSSPGVVRDETVRTLNQGEDWAGYSPQQKAGALEGEELEYMVCPPTRNEVTSTILEQHPRSEAPIPNSVAVEDHVLLSSEHEDGSRRI